MKLMVLDGNSIINRAFYGVSQTLSTRDGQPTNAVFGFVNILGKLIAQEAPDALCVTFDRKAPTFRHLKYDGYKAQRKPMPDELASQMPLVKAVLAAMNIPIYEQDGWEADDLLGTISRICTEAGWETVVVTGDKDSLQLVTDSVTVSLISTRMGQTTTKQVTPAVFYEMYGFTPPHLVDLKALMGDASDNIPGVKGIGEKTAMGLIQMHDSIAEIYKQLPAVFLAPETPAKKGMIEKLTQGKDMAYLSFDLATIRTDAPICFSPEENICKQPDKDALYEIFMQLEFQKLIEKYKLSPASETVETKKEITGTCHSQVLDTKESVENLVSKIKTLPFVAVLPGAELGAVCVMWDEGDDGHAALALADKTPAYHEFLKTLFSADIPKICHGARDLCYTLLSEGISCDGILFDTELAAYLLSPTDGSYDIEKLAMGYGGFTVPSKQTYSAQDAFSPLSDTTQAMAALFSHGATILILYDALEKKLKQQGMDMLFHEVELPLCSVLAQMQKSGFLVDRKALLEFGQILSARIAQETSVIYDLAGEEFNINSTQQMGHILFDNLDIPPVKKTKTGYSTNAEVLEKIKDAHPIVPHILEYRQLAKLKSTYVDGLDKEISSDGRIRTTFQNTVTATGRLSSTEPNLQNIPIRTPLGAKLRDMFVADAQNVLVDADYSQIELRILAHMAQDEKMIAAFLSGQDFHTVTAGEVFRVPVEQVTPQMRRAAKAVNFGIVYGISAFSLSQDIEVSVAQAKQYIQTYFETYPGVRAYLSHAVETAKEKGYAETLFGRKRPMPELKSSNFNLRSFGERVALNMPIQGTAADIIKLSMVRVAARLREENLQAKLVLQVHDELIIECPEEEADKVSALLQEEMQQIVSYRVPLLVQVETGKTWGDTH